MNSTLSTGWIILQRNETTSWSAGLGASAAQLPRCSSYTSKVRISTHECHLWVHFWTLTPVNSNLSRGGTGGNKMHRREPERGDTTLTQIGCDKTPLPSRVHMATYRTARGRLSKARSSWMRQACTCTRASERASTHTNTHCLKWTKHTLNV